jgi:hypothetical protein
MTQFPSRLAKNPEDHCQPGETENLAHTFRREAHVLSTLALIEGTIEKALYNAVRELRNVQDARKRREAVIQPPRNG